MIYLLNLFCAFLMVLSNSLIKKTFHGINLNWYGKPTEWVLNFLNLFKFPLFWAALISFICSILAWIYIISVQNISTAYPIQISFVFILTTISGVYFFNEKISTTGILGLCVILLGIFILLKS